MEKVLTAKEYVEQHPYVCAFLSSAQGYDVLTTFMKDFAKLHIEAALKEVSNNCKIERISDSYPNVIFNQDNYGQLCISGRWAGEYIRINKESILNAYSLENIK